MSRPTAADFRRAARAAFLRPTSPLSPAVVDRPTSNAGMQIEAAGIMGTMILQGVDDRLNGTIPSKSKGARLDDLFWDLYKVKRKGAAPSMGSVVLSRQNTNAGEITIPAKTIISAGVQLETQADIVFGPTDLGPYEVPCQSSQAGATQTVTAGTAATIPAYQSLGVVVAITGDFAGAENAMTDEEFIQYTATYWQDSVRSTVGAIEQGIVSVPGIHLVTVEEEVDAAGIETGYIYAWIADRMGRANSTLVAAAKNNLKEYRPAGTPVFITPATAVFQAISFNCGFRAGVNQIDLVQRAKNALVSRANETRPKQILRRATLQSVLERFVSAGLVLTEDSLSTPLGDVVPGNNEIIRTRADLVTVNA